MVISISSELTHVTIICAFEVVSFVWLLNM